MPLNAAVALLAALDAEDGEEEAVAADTLPAGRS